MIVEVAQTTGTGNLLLDAQAMLERAEYAVAHRSPELIVFSTCALGGYNLGAYTTSEDFRISLQSVLYHLSLHTPVPLLVPVITRANIDATPDLYLIQKNQIRGLRHSQVEIDGDIFTNELVEETVPYIKFDFGGQRFCATFDTTVIDDFTDDLDLDEDEVVLYFVQTSYLLYRQSTQLGLMASMSSHFNIDTSDHWIIAVSGMGLVGDGIFLGDSFATNPEGKLVSLATVGSLTHADEMARGVSCYSNYGTYSKENWGVVEENPVLVDLNSSAESETKVNATVRNSERQLTLVTFSALILGLHCVFKRMGRPVILLRLIPWVQSTVLAYLVYEVSRIEHIDVLAIIPDGLDATDRKKMRNIATQFGFEKHVIRNCPETDIVAGQKTSEYLVKRSWERGTLVLTEIDKVNLALRLAERFPVPREFAPFGDIDPYLLALLNYDLEVGGIYDEVASHVLELKHMGELEADMVGELSNLIIRWVSQGRSLPLTLQFLQDNKTDSLVLSEPYLKEAVSILRVQDYGYYEIPRMLRMSDMSLKEFKPPLSLSLPLYMDELAQNTKDLPLFFSEGFSDVLDIEDPIAQSVQDFLDNENEDEDFFDFEGMEPPLPDELPWDPEFAQKLIDRIQEVTRVAFEEIDFEALESDPQFASTDDTGHQVAGKLFDILKSTETDDNRPTGMNLFGDN